MRRRALLSGASTAGNPLCFTAESAGSTVALNVTGTPTQGQAFEYSTDGETWSSYTIAATITLAAINDTVYFRGINTTVSEDTSIYYKFSLSGQVAASGDATSLMNNVGGMANAPAYCFYGLFFGCGTLTSAPELPSTTVNGHSYTQMFYGCSSLTSAPALPATTLGDSCYYGMFTDCTSLQTAPALPASVLAHSCYYTMFSGCTALTAAPALSAMTLANYCYASMFSDCTALATAPALPATTLSDGCYTNMFYGCFALTAAPALPATTLARSCYFAMFKYTPLVTVPALPATELPSNCYTSMFHQCTALRVYSTSGTQHSMPWTIPTSGTATGTTSFNNMFYGTIGDYSTAASVTVNQTFYTQYSPIV